MKKKSKILSTYFSYSKRQRDPLEVEICTKAMKKLAQEDPEEFKNLVDIFNQESDEDEIDAYFNSSKKSDTNEEVEEKKKEEEEIIVGIDLGTTNSCVGIWRKRNLEIIPDKYGNRTIPSVVAFTQKSRYIGIRII